MTIRGSRLCYGCAEREVSPDEQYCPSCELHMGEEQCGSCGYDRSSLQGCVCDLGYQEGQDFNRRSAA